MKTVFLTLLLAATSSLVCAQNFANSPNNFANSPNNFNATNGIYDQNGNRAGYVVQSPNGVTNYFGNNGNRLGYVPAR